MRANLRLNPKRDKDIIDALANAKNVSAEIRKLLRLAIRGGTLGYSILPSISEVEESDEPKKVKLDAKDLDDLKNNLMSNDFGF